MTVMYIECSYCLLYEKIKFKPISLASPLPEQMWLCLFIFLTYDIKITIELSFVISFIFDILRRVTNSWMDDAIYGFFNSISVISGRGADDNERLCAMEPGLRLRRFRFERGSNSDQQASA